MSRPSSRRPPGTQGAPIKVTTNMYALNMQSDRIIYLYNVDIEPKLSETASRRNYELIDLLQTKTHPQAFQPRAAYDGSKIMLSTVAYPWGAFQEFNVLTSKRNPPPDPGEKGHFIIRISAGPSFPVDSLTHYVRRPDSIPPDEVVQYTNIFLRMAAMHTHAFRGNNFYVTPGHRLFGDWLMLRRGFFQSVRATATGPMVNMDITSALLWIQRPLMETVVSLLGMSNHRDLERLNDTQTARLRHLMRGVRVRPRHRPDAGARPIHGFDKRGANAIRLDENGPTVEDYFHEKYNIRLQHPKYLCVSMSGGRQDLVPIELLTIDANQFFDLKKLPMVPNVNPAWDKQIRSFAMVKPAERLQITNTASVVLQHQQSDYMRRAGLSINPTPTEIKGRMLRSVPVMYGNGVTATPRFSAWKNSKFYAAMTVETWAVIILDDRAQPPAVRNFVQQLTSAMENCGMRVLDRDPMMYPKNAREDMKQLLQRVHADMRTRFKKAPSLLLIITPGDADWYTEMKRFGDITLGIATQHVQASKALSPRGNAEYCDNVALKINVKLGGINFVPQPDAIKWIRDGEPLMVIGADTSHPRPGEGWKPTIAAISYSLDRDVSKYNGIVALQPGRQEIISSLGSMVTSAINNFKARQKGPTQYAPRRILYYRDGVGEGMLADVVSQECQAIRKAFRDAKEAEPKITAIVVGKRHHLRFYPQGRDADRSGNVNPGLVIDHTITSPIHDDFYLLSHQGIIGTSRSMHAIPIVDDNRLDADRIQGLTFALTHTYQRATRSVSIPAPIYYADILCSHPRARIHFDPTIDFGSDTMTSADQHPTGAQYLQAFKPIAQNLRNTMFWM